MFQSTIDLVGYAAGQTDEFRGTGVWSGVKMKREKPEDISIQMDDGNKKSTVDPAKQKAEEKTVTASK